MRQRKGAGLPLAPAWAKLLQIPRPYLYAGILFFASMGAYAVNSQPFDLWLLLALGLLGFAMRRFGLPVLPLIVGVILGPLVERKGRQSLQLTGGDISGLVGGPVAWVCYVLIVVAIAWPLISALLRRGRGGHGDDRPRGGDGSGGGSASADVDDRAEGDDRRPFARSGVAANPAGPAEEER